MSKLDELIGKLCPNGVEYKSLGEIATISRGGNFQKKDFCDRGVPCIHYGQIYTKYGLFVDKTITFITEERAKKQKFAKKNDIVMAVTSENIEDVCKCLAWLGNEEVAVSGHSAIIRHNQNPKYLVYYFHSQMFFSQKRKLAHGTKVIEVTPDTLKSIKLPVPPLEVQREIVHILDSFTLLTAELTAELTVELTARKKQYEFYRDELLSVKKNIPIVKLGDVATEFYRGSGIKRDEVTDTGIPCVRYGEIYTTYNTWFDKCVSYTKLDFVKSPKYFENGDILFAITGESVEDIAKSVAYIGHEKCLAGGDIVVMKHNQNPRYLAHVLATTEARMQKSKGKVKSKVVHSNVPSIKEIQIPLPSLEIQEKYANVLDNFEAICTDLNIGLPAEIEARQKQYEYYRDLLLTFAETGNMLETDRQTDRQTELNAIKLVQYVFGYAPVRLELIAKISRGGNFQKKDFITSGKPCIHYGQIYTHFGIYADKTLTFVNDKIFEKAKIAKSGDIIMAVTSENVEDVCSCTAWLGDEDIAVSGHTAIISHNQNAKFMSYYFHSSDFFMQKKKLAHGTKVIEVTPNKLKDIIIMLPTLEEQKRIVTILDRFDTLCNDLSAGLPAEIEARQKQYEYYRDKLLSFKGAD